MRWFVDELGAGTFAELAANRVLARTRKPDQQNHGVL